jgi:hypothetical protein
MKIIEKPTWRKLEEERGFIDVRDLAVNVNICEGGAVPRAVPTQKVHVGKHLTYKRISVSKDCYQPFI